MVKRTVTPSLWRKTMKKISLILGIMSAFVAVAFNTGLTVATAEEKTENAVEYFERSLVGQGTSVVAEFEERIAEYQTRLLVETDATKKSQLNTLIENTERLLETYQREKPTAKPMTAVVTANEPQPAEPTYVPKDADVFFYENTVSAVVAYFYSNGYDLAAELLTHARFNSVRSSLYTPINLDCLYESTAFNAVRESGEPYGSEEFVKQGSVKDMDLFYAMHYFRYAKFQGGEVLTVYDNYDFIFDGNYDFIDDVPIKVMYMAQERGVIVPFNVVIETRLSGDCEDRENETFPRISYMNGEYHVYKGGCACDCVVEHADAHRTPFGEHGDGNEDGLCDGCELRIGTAKPKEETVVDRIASDAKDSLVGAYDSVKTGVLAILDACGVGCSGSLGGTLGAGSAIFVGGLLFKKKKEN